MIRTSIFALLLAASAAAWAQAPRTIPYQGYLTTTGGVPVNATVQMTFALYPEAVGGTAAWSETQTVPVSNGNYNVTLGSATPLPEVFNAAYYLGVAVGTDAEMAPRLALGAVPYSLFAASAGCKPGDMITCYEGAAGTMNVGPCRPGVRTCNEQGTGFGACAGQVLPVAESCGDQVDNNCNGAVNEGCAAPTCTVGVPLTCGVGACFRSVACTTGFETCTPGQPSTEVCNNVDDNCDGATDNGAFCSLSNATSVCSAGACQVQSCQPGFGNCDPSHANGCEQQLNTLQHCGGCNIQCNLPNANESCASGSCQLTSCASGFANVDGNMANGCEVALNTNPVCSSSFQTLGTVSGDTGQDSVSVSDIGERWYRLRLTENNDGVVYLSAQIVLTSPQGSNYDLFVYCLACGGSLAGSSISSGSTDVVTVRWDDDFGADDSADVLIEVRYVSGTSNANWQLSATGNLVATLNTCNP